METAIVSLFPDAVETALDMGVTGRARREGRFSCRVYNPRAYSDDARATVDDRPFGGGPGMVMMVPPLRGAVQAAKAALPPESPVIFLSPQGERFDQRLALEFAALPGFVLVAARYEGVDERFVASEVDREVSIGDYVLSGGELPALVVMDAVARLLPGALGNAESALRESHVDGTLDCPQYTRPAEDASGSVPSVLLSGDHAAVERWRRKEVLRRTWRRRPELLLERELAAVDRELLVEAIEDETHYTLGEKD